jgi:hypothetical protein
MSITVSWDNSEHTIIQCVYQGAWTWTEFYAAVEEVNKLETSVNHKVYILLDFHSSHMPGGVPSQFKRISQIQHPNAGPMIIIGHNLFVRTMFDIFTRIQPQAAERYRFVSHRDEAYTLIAELHAGENLVR